jgi:hypothetical protein
MEAITAGFYRPATFNQVDEFIRTATRLVCSNTLVINGTPCEPTPAPVPAEERPLVGTELTRYKDTIFLPLPRSQWRPCTGGCCCEYCSADPKKSEPAFWDTLVISAKPPKKGQNDYASDCHHPALQGAKPKR